MSALATVAGKSFHGKITAKIDFPIGYFMSPVADGLSILFDKYLDHLLVEFEQNCMVQTIQNFELFDKKWLTTFDKKLTPFWKSFLCLLFLLNY